MYKHEHIPCAEALEARCLLSAKLPDLVPWADESQSFLYGWNLDRTRMPGRLLLRMNTVIANAGVGPLELRGQEIHPDGTQDVVQRIYDTDGSFTERLAGVFTHHPAHGHIHFDEFANFNLRALGGGGMPGGVVATTEKVSFCLYDLVIYDSTLPGFTNYQFRSCESIQGLSVGWADLYTASLEGQWIDITGLPYGEYYLELVADPADHILELDESNNETGIVIQYVPPPPILSAGATGQHSVQLSWTQLPGSPTGAAGPDTFYIDRKGPNGAWVEIAQVAGQLSAHTDSLLTPATMYEYRIRAGRGSFISDFSTTLSAVTAQPVLTGSGAADHYRLRSSAGGDEIELYINTAAGAGPTYVIPRATFSSLAIDAGGGDDVLEIDLNEGPAIPVDGITYDGGGGQDQIHLFGGAGAEAGRLLITGGTVALAGGFPALTLEAENSSTVQFTASQHLAALVLRNSARAILSAGGSKLLELEDLSLSVSASLDLRDGALRVAAGADLQARLQSIFAHVRSARNSGSAGVWSGPGITSSNARDDITGLTGLAVVPAEDGVDVSYTWNGDADGDGAVTKDDFTRIDRGFLGRKMLFHEGNFNYDFIIDMDDYGLIDEVFLEQIPGA